MLRHLVFLLAIGALTTACGSANEQGRDALKRFRTDALSETTRLRSPPAARSSMNASIATITADDFSVGRSMRTVGPPVARR